MTPAEFHLVREVFEDAMGRQGPELEAALSRAGPSGHPTRCRVESLLRDSKTDGQFLETPVVPAAAALAVAESALLAEQDLLVGRRVGRYLVRRLIGSGGMGNVYEAQQEQPERLVALKVVQPALAGRSSLRRFEHEASLLARLRHPGIAQVYEAGAASIEVDGRSMVIPFFAMEHLADAAPITEFANSRGLGIDERLALLAQVCDAVHHGHQRGVIHRDLKPANILVEAGGQPKIIDFGIARAADADTAGGTSPTLAGQVLGTLAYMSPEQLSGDPGEIDTRTDVYALGVVLYELVAGRPPFEIATKPLAEAARIVRDEQPPRLAGQDPSLRGDIETIVGKAIAKDRAERYASAAQLADDIRRFLRSEPIEARPPSAMYQMRLFARRNRALVGAVAAVAGTLAIATAATTGLALFATRQAQAAVAAREVATLERDRALRVAEFLEGALASANPRLASTPGDVRATDYDPYAEWRTTPWPYVGKPGHKATVPDILIAATERLDAAFPDDPATRARLATAMGRTLFSLSDDEVDLAPARDILQKAVDDARLAYGDDHEATIRASLFLGDALGHTGPVGANAPYFERAIAGAERLFGKFDARTLRAYHFYAVNIHLWTGEHQRAVELLKGVLDAADQAGPETAHKPAVLLLRAFHGLSHWWIGQGDAGERIARESVAELLRVEGPDSAYTAEASGYLADTLQKLGKLDEAAEIYTRAADNYARRLGENSWWLVGAWGAVGTVRMQQGNWPEAERAMRRSVDLSRSLLGPQKYDTWTRLGSLVAVLHRQEKHGPETEALAREALESSSRHRFLRGANEKARQESEAWAMFYQRVIAESIFAQGRREEAERMMREQMAQADASEHLAIHRGAIRYRLAARLLELERAAEAETLLREAERILREQKREGTLHWREYEAIVARLEASKTPR